jgi:hypothetical protein
VPPGSANAPEPSGQVTFYDGQTALGSVPIQNGTANFTTSALSLGSHSISANYPGDSNLLGSTSRVLTQVVVVPSSGGGGGTGGGTSNTGLGISSTCGCAQSGPYADPAAPVNVATTSPHNKYVVTPGAGFITVAVPSGADPLTVTLPASGYSWGFSPDDDRFVFHFLTGDPGPPNMQIDNIEVFDLTATPPRMIGNATSVVGALTSLSFSPSGRYFLVQQAIGNTSAEDTIYLVQGVTSQQQVYDTGLYNFAVGSGTDYQTVSVGFSPDSPESAFVFAYLVANATNPNTFQWNLVSLSTGKAESFPVDTSGHGSFWKFNPCGTVVGLATQTASNQASVDLFATSFVDPNTAHLPNAASGLPLNFTLFANLALQEVQSTDQNGISQTSILTSDPSCSSNTPAGSNVVVSSAGPIAGASQVSVTFGNVTTAGVTAITPLSPTNGTCPAGPGGFQLAGSPPICFDLSTTAKYNISLTPAITVCVTISGATSGLTFAHFQNGAYVNSTVTVPNEPANEICAGVQSLSPFAIFQRVPVPLTITANPVSRQYGTADPPFTVSYSGFVNGEGPSVLSGQLSCLGNDTISSPVGSYAIDCSSSTLTSPNYIITYAKGALNVTPAPLTLAADNKAMTYGMAVPALTFSPSGFVNGDTVASLSTQPSPNTAATSSSSVGSYAITFGGAVDSNYTISYTSGTLNISPAQLTITANSPVSRPYGANNPVLIGVISGLQNSDPITAAFMTPASPASPGGTYPITPFVSDPSNRLGNYAVSLVNGTLTVVPETTSLSIAFSPLSIMVGQSTTATITLTATDMVVPIPNNSSILTPFTLTSPLASDMLSNNGVCTPVPSATVPAVASCTVTVTSVEPNGRTLLASFAGSADLAASTSAASGTGQLMVTAALNSQPVCIASDFRNVAVPGNNIIWFNSIFKVRDVSKQLLHVTFYNSSAQFQYTDAGGNLVIVNLPLPDAHITVDPSATSSTTSYDSINKVWNTAIPWDLDDNSFLTGASWTIPSAGLPADVEPVAVCGTFASDVASIDIGWRWATAAYSSFPSDFNALGVKPMDTDSDNPDGTPNHDLAGTPENFKQYVIAGARGKGGKNYTGSYSRSAVIE